MARGGRTTRKVQGRINAIFDGLQQGKEVKEIAEEQGITQRAVYYNMQRPEFQTLIDNMAVGIVRNTESWINELHDSEDPLDKRLAASLSVQLVKSFAPRIVQTTEQTLKMSLTQQKSEFSDVFGKLTPEEQAPFIEAWKKKKLLENPPIADCV
jgi:predicted DNA-binding protein YlxM (UPF0122 family)